MVDFQAGLQLRFFCQVQMVIDEGNLAMRERFWQKLSPRSKIELYAAHPQQPKPPDCFVMLQLTAASAELLELNTEPPRRYRYANLDNPSEEVLTP